jgi:hypothetical protein
MSVLKVNVITNKNEGGAVELPQGGIIPAGQQLSVTGNYEVTGILTVANYSTPNLNVTGVVTATSFVGDGSNLTNLPVITPSKVIAYKRILGYDEYRA